MNEPDVTKQPQGAARSSVQRVARAPDWLLKRDKITQRKWQHLDMKNKLNPSKKRPQAGRTRAVAPRSAFRAGTGLLGATESGQRVTKENAHLLPPGSVVRLDDGGRLIHLHNELWLYCCDCAWCYDGIERHAHRLPGTLCHLPPNTESSDATRSP